MDPPGSSTGVGASVRDRAWSSYGELGLEVPFPQSSPAIPPPIYFPLQTGSVVGPVSLLSSHITSMVL